MLRQINMSDLKKTMQKRTAYQTEGLVMRESKSGDSLGVIEGVAIVTEQETVIYEDASCRELEVIAPSCVTDEVIKNQDIKINLLHDRGSSFGRSKQGEGSLKLDARADGLHFEIEVPDCDLGKRAKALVDNGTYTGCSFEFWPKDYEVSEREGKDGKTEYLVRHTAFERIGAITIGMDPAYEQTSVQAREIYEEAHDGEQRKLREKKKAEERAERERRLRLMEMD